MTEEQKKPFRKAWASEMALDELVKGWRLDAQVARTRAAALRSALLSANWQAVAGVADSLVATSLDLEALAEKHEPR